MEYSEIIKVYNRCSPVAARLRELVLDRASIHWRCQLATRSCGRCGDCDDDHVGVRVRAVQ